MTEADAADRAHMLRSEIDRIDHDMADLHGRKRAAVLELARLSVAQPVAAND